MTVLFRMMLTCLVIIAATHCTLQESLDTDIQANGNADDDNGRRSYCVVDSDFLSLFKTVPAQDCPSLSATANPDNTLNVAASRINNTDVAFIEAAKPQYVEDLDSLSIEEFIGARAVVSPAIEEIYKIQLKAKDIEGAYYIAFPFSFGDGCKTTIGLPTTGPANGKKCALAYVVFEIIIDEDGHPNVRPTLEQDPVATDSSISCSVKGASNVGNVRTGPSIKSVVIGQTVLDQSYMVTKMCKNKSENGRIWYFTEGNWIAIDAVYDTRSCNSLPVTDCTLILKGTPFGS